MTSGVKAVCLQVGHVRIDDCDGEESLASCKALDSQSWRIFTDVGIHILARSIRVPSKAQCNVHNGVTVGDHIGNNLHGLSSLYLDLPTIVSPFLLSKMPVDWLVHITCNCQYINKSLMFLTYLSHPQISS